MTCLLNADLPRPEQGPRRDPRPRGADRLRVGDDAPLRRLVTIPISHYCEKARWALERAGLAYVEERHVQGVHRLASRRAGGGGTRPRPGHRRTACSPQSEWIVRYADAHLPPELRLFTGDPEVEALCRWLDAGARPRRPPPDLHAHAAAQPELMLPYNNQGVPAWEARALTRAVPGRRRAGPGASWPSRDPDDDRRCVFAAFDAIAERLGDGRRYLCGDRFTAADLTFACLAAAVVAPARVRRRAAAATLPEPVARDVARSARTPPAPTR